MLVYSDSLFLNLSLYLSLGNVGVRADHMFALIMITLGGFALI